MRSIRKTLGLLCSPFMAVTGYRFSKRHRHEETLTYRVVDTVGANFAADRLIGE